MRNLSLLVLLFLLQSNLSISQISLLNETKAPSNLLPVDASSTLSPKFLFGSLNETLDHAFDSVTALSPVKGFTAAMMLPDGSVWKRAKGLATQIPANTTLTPDDLMGMGSITKSFVSATLLLLYEDGLISLDDHINQYVGPYTNIDGNITIKQMLSHRSGINDYLNENPAMTEAWANNVDSIWTLETILNHYVLAPNFSPGASWSYSNTNYLLAGRIIEVITGEPWYQVVRERILDPLSLTHTFAYPWETPGSQPFSHVWADFNGDGFVEDIQGIGVPLEGFFSMAGSAGCLISTAEDIAKFHEKLYGGHILQPATLVEMQKDYLQDGSGGTYGLGTSSYTLPFPLENWGHNGNIVYKSIALDFPELDMALAVQQNDDRQFNPNDLHPILDLNFVFIAVLEAYLNYSPVSATVEGRKADMRPEIFPNPARQTFTLHIPEQNHMDFPQRCLLTDMSGCEIFSQMIEQDNNEIFIGQLPPGIYTLRIAGYTQTLIKN